MIAGCTCWLCILASCLCSSAPRASTHRGCPIYFSPQQQWFPVLQSFITICRKLNPGLSYLSFMTSRCTTLFIYWRFIKPVQESSPSEVCDVQLRKKTLRFKELALWMSQVFDFCPEIYGGVELLEPMPSFLMLVASMFSERDEHRFLLVVLLGVFEVSLRHLDFTLLPLKTSLYWWLEDKDLSPRHGLINIHFTSHSSCRQLLAGGLLTERLFLNSKHTYGDQNNTSRYVIGLLAQPVGLCCKTSSWIKIPMRWVSAVIISFQRRWSCGTRLAWESCRLASDFEKANWDEASDYRRFSPIPGVTES